MVTFKSVSDLSKLPADDPAFPIVEELVDQLIRAYADDYDADAYGYITLVEECDVHGFWDDWHLADLLWEGIMRRDDYFVAIYLANNEFGIVFVIPDAPWITGRIREVINENLDP